VLLVVLFSHLHGESLIHSSPDAYDLDVENPHFVIVHAEVLHLSAPETSFAQPAHAKIRIHKVLRGRNTAARDAVASFSPPLLHNMMVDPQHGNYELKPEEKVRAFSLPPVGSHILLSYCCVGKDENEISTQGHLVSWSQQNEVNIAHTAVPMEASGGRQAVLFLLILVVTVCGIVLAITARRRPTLGAGCFLGSFLLYVMYESGISTYTNIRVDLLLIYPILLLNLLGLIWQGYRTMRESAMDHPG
jgi:hypothetical protein